MNLGLGLRLDSREYIAMQLDLGVNTRQKGHTFNLSGRLGFTSGLKVAYKYKSRSGIDLVADSGIKLVDHNRYSDPGGNFELNFIATDAGLGLHSAIGTNHMAECGLRFERFQFKDGSAEAMLGTYLSVSGDTFDDGYFPKSGIKYSISHNWRFLSQDNPTRPFHALRGDVHGAVPLSGRFTFLPEAGFRFLFSDSAVPLPFSNMMTLPGSTSRFGCELPFFGLNQSVLVGENLLATAAATLRYSTKYGHLSLTGDMGCAADRFRDIKEARTFYGAGLSYGFSFIIGPVIRTDLHWSSISGFGAYLCLGVDF